MIRLVARLSAGLALIFAVFIAAVQAQPPDDDVRTFLLPPQDCTAPCWAGIRPGVTTLDQAIALLEANPWVEQVSVRNYSIFSYLYVEWSDLAPSFTDDPGGQLPTYILVQRDIIHLIVIPTRITYGDVYEVMGAPGAGSFTVSGYRNSVTLGDSPNTRHTAVYFDGKVMFDTRMFCPVSLSAFWNAPVTITYNAPDNPPLSVSRRYDLIHWIFSPPCKL